MNLGEPELEHEKLYRTHNFWILFKKLAWHLTLVLILQEHIQTIQVAEETLSYWIGTKWWKWPLWYWEKSFEHLKLDTVEKDSVGLTTQLVSKYSSCLKYRKNKCLYKVTWYFSYFSSFFEDIIRRFGLFPLPKKTTYVTVPLGDRLEKKKETALIIKQQFGSPIKIT